MKIAVQRLAHAHDLMLPAYATTGAAGLDLLAAVENEIELRPGERMAVPCGIAIALPNQVEAQVRSRSGLALHHGVTVLNAPGTIDSDYRGEVMAILINLGSTTFHIVRGMKIAKLVIAPYARGELMENLELPESARGSSGFGSTG